MFRNLSSKPTSFSSLEMHLPDVEVSSLRVEEGSSVVGKSLPELELRKKHGVTVLAVRRDSKTFPNPDVDMTFFADDVFYVMGLPEKLAESAKLFSKREADDVAIVCGNQDVTGHAGKSG
jgi:CPA2 family monovalent cation:H+ antiporter-2